MALDPDSPLPYVDWLGQKVDAGALKDIRFGAHIYTTDEETIEQNAQEAGVTPDRAFWDEVERNLAIIEANCLQVLRASGLHVSDEGHDESGRVASVWIDTYEEDRKLALLKAVINWAEGDWPSTSSGTMDYAFGADTTTRIYQNTTDAARFIDVAIEFTGTDALSEWSKLNLNEAVEGNPDDPEVFLKSYVPRMKGRVMIEFNQIKPNFPDAPANWYREDVDGTLLFRYNRASEMQDLMRHAYSYNRTREDRAGIEQVTYRFHVPNPTGHILARQFLEKAGVTASTMEWVEKTNAPIWFYVPVKEFNAYMKMVYPKVKLKESDEDVDPKAYLDATTGWIDNFLNAGMTPNQEDTHRGQFWKRYECHGYNGLVNVGTRTPRWITVEFNDSVYGTNRFRRVFEYPDRWVRGMLTDFAAIDRILTSERTRAFGGLPDATNKIEELYQQHKRNRQKFLDGRLKEALDDPEMQRYLDKAVREPCFHCGNDLNQRHSVIRTYVQRNGLTHELSGHYDQDGYYTNDDKISANLLAALPECDLPDDCDTCMRCGKSTLHPNRSRRVESVDDAANYVRDLPVYTMDEIRDEMQNFGLSFHSSMEGFMPWGRWIAIKGFAYWSVYSKDPSKYLPPDFFREQLEKFCKKMGFTVYHTQIFNEPPVPIEFRLAIPKIQVAPESWETKANILVDPDRRESSEVLNSIQQAWLPENAEPEPIPDDPLSAKLREIDDRDDIAKAKAAAKEYLAQRKLAVEGVADPDDPSVNVDRHVTDLDINGVMAKLGFTDGRTFGATWDGWIKRVGNKEWRVWPTTLTNIYGVTRLERPAKFVQVGRGKRYGQWSDKGHFTCHVSELERQLREEGALNEAIDDPDDPSVNVERHMASMDIDPIMDRLGFRKLTPSWKCADPDYCWYELHHGKFKWTVTRKSDDEPHMFEINVSRWKPIQGAYGSVPNYELIGSSKVHVGEIEKKVKEVLQKPLTIIWRGMGIHPDEVDESVDPDNPEHNVERFAQHVDAVAQAKLDATIDDAYVAFEAELQRKGVRTARKADEIAAEVGAAVAEKAGYPNGSEEFDWIVSAVNNAAGRLFPGNWEDYEESKKRYVMLPIQSVMEIATSADYPDKTWPEIFEHFNHRPYKADIGQLVRSLRQRGVQYPVNLHICEGDPKIYFSNGHHRLWLSHLLGLTHIPVRHVNEEKMDWLEWTQMLVDEGFLHQRDADRYQDRQNDESNAQLNLLIAEIDELGEMATGEQTRAAFEKMANIIRVTNMRHGTALRDVMRKVQEDEVDPETFVKQQPIQVRGTITAFNGQHQIDKHFNAEMYFDACANEDDLESMLHLVKTGLENTTATDLIADYFSDTVLKDFTQQYKANGYAVYIDEDDLKRWVEHNKPEWFAYLWPNEVVIESVADPDDPSMVLAAHTQDLEPDPEKAQKIRQHTHGELAAQLEALGFETSWVAGRSVIFGEPYVPNFWSKRYPGSVLYVKLNTETGDVVLGIRSRRMPIPIRLKVRSLAHVGAIVKDVDAAMQQLPPQASKEQEREAVVNVLDHHRQWCVNLGESTPDDPEKFVQHFVDKNLGVTFHICKSGDQNVYGSDPFRHDWLVYSDDKEMPADWNQDDGEWEGTRTWEGYLRQNGQRWIAFPRAGKKKVRPIGEFDTQNEAAYAIYRHLHPKMESVDIPPEDEPSNVIPAAEKGLLLPELKRLNFVQSKKVKDTVWIYGHEIPRYWHKTYQAADGKTHALYVLFYGGQKPEIQTRNYNTDANDWYQRGKDAPPQAPAETEAGLSACLRDLDAAMTQSAADSLPPDQEYDVIKRVVDHHRKWWDDTLDYLIQNRDQIRGRIGPPQAA